MHSLFNKGKGNAMNRDQIEGKAKKAKGAVKEKTGELLGDRELESEGTSERGTGRARELYGKAREAVGQAVKDLGKKVKGK
jgi:uncharacterized protein YjbJ (UPF0337 family)